MQKTFISLALLTAVLLGATAANAGDESRSGTTGATELRIPIGARSIGIGGAVVADVRGVDGIFWNPAGVARNDGQEAAYSYTSYFADMDLNWIGFASEFGAGHIGFNAKILSIGDIIVTTEDAPDGTGEIISPTFSVLGVSYARELTDRVLVGATLNLINESVLQQTATGIGFDFGFQYLLGAQGLSFGLAIKNVGPKMEFSGGDLETTFIPPEGDPQGRPRTFSSISSSFELPSYISLGVSYRLFEGAQSQFLLNGDFQSNAFSGDEFRGGAEYAFFAGENRETALRFRGGWNQADQDDFLFSGGAFGVGVDFKVGTSRARIDYAYNLLNTDFRDFFDDLNTVSLSYQF